MSWSGTLRCSYCYAQGHNRRTCPDIIERYLQSYKRADTESVRNHYADELAKRGIDPKTGKKMTVAQRTKSGAGRATMRCGYCSDRGHTRRSCQNLKNDYEVYKHISREYRVEFLEKLREIGVGVGSLLVSRQYGYVAGTGEHGYQQMPHMITGISWEEVNAHTRDADSVVVRDLLPTRQGRLTVGTRNLGQIERMLDAGQVLQVCGELKLNAPDGWLEFREVRPLKEVFDSKNERGYIYNNNTDDPVTAAREALDLPYCADHDS